MVQMERFAVGSIECQIVPDGAGMYEPVASRWACRWA